jgi:hypothetical protein
VLAVVAAISCLVLPSAATVAMSDERRAA